MVEDCCSRAFKLLVRMILVVLYHCKLAAQTAARAAHRHMPCDRLRRYRNQIKRRPQWEATRSLSQVRRELEARGICTRTARQSRSLNGVPLDVLLAQQVSSKGASRG